MKARIEKKAFTLIELLVVLAVISILAAIIFPVFSQAKRQAKGVTCTSQLHQLGMAVALYTQDWDGYYPNGGDGRKGFNPVADAGPLYKDQISNYLGSTRILRCPLDFGAIMSDTDRGSIIGAQPTAFEVLGTSYAYQLTGGYPRVISESEVSSVSDQIVFWDLSGAWHSGEALITSSSTNAEWRSAVEDYRYMSLYYDLHVKSLNRDTWLTSRTFPGRG